MKIDLLIYRTENKSKPSNEIFLFGHNRSDILETRTECCIVAIRSTRERERDRPTFHERERVRTTHSLELEQNIFMDFIDF